MREKGKPRRHSNSVRISLSALVSDQHLFQCHPKCQAFCKTDIAGKCRNSGKVVRSHWAGIWIGLCRSGQRLRVACKARSQRNLGGKPLSRVARAYTKVHRRQGPSSFPGRDRTCPGLKTHIRNHIKVSPYSYAQLQTSSGRCVSAVETATVVRAQREGPVMKIEIASFLRLRIDGAFELLNYQRLIVVWVFIIAPPRKTTAQNV